MRVTVTEAVFAGERCRYMLQAAGGTAMVLKETVERRDPPPDRGRGGEIAWSVADTDVV